MQGVGKKTIASLLLEMEMFDEKGLEYFFAACTDEFILLIPHLLMITLLGGKTLSEENQKVIFLISFWFSSICISFIKDLTVSFSSSLTIVLGAYITSSLLTERSLLEILLSDFLILS
ncbi:hypothetical protein [Bacillus safensis]|uniref:hypothetical protein n=1 Tax=Bacillus safensis TaxID=561879 RepID=UPI003983ABEE